MKIEGNFTDIPFQEKKTASSNFANDFKKFLLEVDKELKTSKELKREFIEGKDIPIYQISIQAQKAKISLELLTKIRDEALKSYNAIINIRI